MKNMHERLTNEYEEVYEAVHSLSEIAGVATLNFSDLHEWKQNSVDKWQEVDDDLKSFTKTGNKIDVNETMRQIESVMSQVRSHAWNARFESFKGASRIDALRKLIDYNAENDRSEEIEEAKTLEIMCLRILIKAPGWLMIKHF